MTTVCTGHEAGTTISVYELNGGKAPRYFADREGFADAISSAMRQSRPPELEIAAVGCGVSSTRPGETLSSDTSSIVMYELWDQDLYLALVFTRAHPSADWMIEKYWNIFPSAVPNPITNGVRIDAYTFTGADAFEVYSYEPTAAPADTVTPHPPLTLDRLLAALAGAGYPTLRGGNNLGCAPGRGQVDPVAGQDYRAGDASFHAWVYPSAAELLARWDVAPDGTAWPKATSGCPALHATYANQNIVIAFERTDPPQAAIDAVLGAR